MAIVEITKPVKCCICGEEIPPVVRNGHVLTIGQNNPWPFFAHNEDKVCCNDCNAMYVLPARFCVDVADREDIVVTNPMGLIRLVNNLHDNGYSQAADYMGLLVALWLQLNDDDLDED